MQRKGSFHHESLVEPKRVREILEAISSGIAAGELEFSDDQSEISMKPEGLLHMKVTAEKEDGYNRLALKITWQDEPELPKKKSPLKVNKK